MPPELATLQCYLLVGAALFGIGMIGFLCRRNMIVMFLSAEMMLQGVSLSLIAWGRYNNDIGGQMLVIFIIAVAACEAAIALAVVLMLFERKGHLDIVMWDDLRESNQPPFEEAALAPLPEEASPHWPILTRSGVLPEPPGEKESYRPKV